MKKRTLPVGITVSKTEPWFRYSRGQQAKPTYFYYGTKAKKADALKEAVAFALQQNKKWTPKIAAARIGRKTRSNRSGVVGVSIKTEKRRIRGSHYYYWWARWPGCMSGIKFSILQHKDTKAFCLARIAREIKSQDRAAVEREYLVRKKAGKLRALLAQKEQKG
ncbi:MAG: hypothetical protein ABIZ56_10585 [Chthoniobacteraceae bacterium]